ALHTAPHAHAARARQPSQREMVQQGQRRTTRRIVNTAAAAAWLPHSTPRHTRMPRGQGNQAKK
ncbi:MAG: hypothetical protein ACUVSO_15115, partial [Chloroflexus sp.]